MVHPPELEVLGLLWAIASDCWKNAAGELSLSISIGVGKGLTAVLSRSCCRGPASGRGMDPIGGARHSPIAKRLSPYTTAVSSVAVACRVECSKGLIHGSPPDWSWTHHPTWAGTIPQADATARCGLGLRTGYRCCIPAAIIEVNRRVCSIVSSRPSFARGRKAPTPVHVLARTLLVQPNAEILAYRQGFDTPLDCDTLAVRSVEGTGPACTLELTARSKPVRVSNRGYTCR